MLPKSPQDPNSVFETLWFEGEGYDDDPIQVSWRLVRVLKTGPDYVVVDESGRQVHTAASLTGARTWAQRYALGQTVDWLEDTRPKTLAFVKKARLAHEDKFKPRKKAPAKRRCAATSRRRAFAK